MAEVEAGIASGMITGGMIPKVENCVEAVRARRQGRGHPGRPACRMRACSNCSPKPGSAR